MAKENKTSLGGATQEDNVKPIVDQKLLSTIVQTLEQQGKQIEEQKEIISKQNKDIARLTYAADVGRLGQFDDKNRGTLIKKVNLNIFKEKIVVGWKMVKDEVGVNEKGVLTESQIIRVFTLSDSENGKPDYEDVPYIYFSRNLKQLPASIIKKSLTNDGVETAVVETDDGHQIEIDLKFVN